MTEKDSGSPTPEEEKLTKASGEAQKGRTLADLGAVDEITPENFQVLSSDYPDEFAGLRLNAIRSQLRQVDSLIPLAADEESLSLVIGKINSLQEKASETIKSWLHDIEPAKLEERPFVFDEDEAYPLTFAIDFGLYESINERIMPFLKHLPKGAVRRYKIRAALNALRGWEEIEDLIRKGGGFVKKDEEISLHDYAKSQIEEHKSYLANLDWKE